MWKHPEKFLAGWALHIALVDALVGPGVACVTAICTMLAAIA